MSDQTHSHSDPKPGHVSADPVETRSPAHAADWTRLARSWDDGEYDADWGLAGVDAAYAYALGDTGRGVTVGVVDSGVYAAHPEFKDRDGAIKPLEISGTYAADGYQYEPGPYVPPDWQDHTWKTGQSFDVAGTYDGAYNDPHGTHVTGTIAAARDGHGMHGVAFQADVDVANTHGTDQTIYGPNVDYNYFEAAYAADAKNGARAINTSWGDASMMQDSTTLQGLTQYYETFLGHKTYLDAMGDVAKRYDIIQVLAAGNDGAANPDIRNSLPYFRPDLEDNWLTVGAAAEGPSAGPLGVTPAYFSDKAGIAKYWTVFAPGLAIESTIPPSVPGDAWRKDTRVWGVDPGHQTGYTSVSGTSMSAPHATGALAVIMQRYGYLDNEEARDVLLTTAAHHDALDGTADHTAGDGSGLARDDAPNAVWGWGAVDLKAAMDGPGQFLGAFTVDMGADQSDTWNNTITEDALIQRRAEDAAEQATWQQTLAAEGWTTAPPTAASSLDDRTAYAVGTARAAAAAARNYQGSLVKEGDGTLTLDGAGSSYSGGTVLDGGALELGALGAAGTGAIAFGGPAQLILDAAAFGSDGALANVLDRLGAGDTIDFKDAAFGSGDTAALSGDTIALAFGSADYSLTLGGALQATLALASDGAGGTLLSFAAPPPPPPPAPPAGTPPAAGPGAGAPAPAGPPEPVVASPSATNNSPATPPAASPDGTTTTTTRDPDGTVTTTVLRPDGSRTVTVAGGPFFDPRPYGSTTDRYGPDGTALGETRERKDGHHAMAARAPGQSLFSLGDDTMSGNGQASTAFVFTPGFGQDTVLGFDAFGVDHGVLTLAASSFSSLIDVLHHTRNTVSGALITDPATGDAITVVGVTKAQLLHNPADVAFHA